MRNPFVAGNWKMNTTATEAEQLVFEMLEKLDRMKEWKRYFVRHSYL